MHLDRGSCPVQRWPWPVGVRGCVIGGASLMAGARVLLLWSIYCVPGLCPAGRGNLLRAAGSGWWAGGPTAHWAESYLCLLQRPARELWPVRVFAWTGPSLGQKAGPWPGDGRGWRGAAGSEGGWAGLAHAFPPIPLLLLLPLSLLSFIFTESPCALTSREKGRARGREGENLTQTPC